MMAGVCCYFVVIFVTVTNSVRRSQWSSGLRHELSLLAWTLGSWVRISLQAWMFACLFCVCVVPCVGSGLAAGGLFKGSNHLCKKITKLKKRPGPKKGCRAIVEWMKTKSVIFSLQTIGDLHNNNITNIEKRNDLLPSSSPILNDGPTTE
jgi:hypothetical protein